MAAWFGRVLGQLTPASKTPFGTIKRGLIYFTIPLDARE